MALSYGYSAFDPVARQLYFLSGSAGSQLLVIADLPSGAVSTRSIAISDSYIFFEWDSASRRILSVTTQPGRPVVSIDPATGAIQKLFDTNVSALAYGYSASDPVGRQLYFLSGSASSQQLVVADLPSGTVSFRSIAISAGSYLFFEFAPAPTAVPALGPALLAALVVSLLGIGCFVIRGRGPAINSFLT